MKAMEPIEQLCALLKETDGYALLRNADVAANLARGGDVDLLVDDPHAFSQRLLEELGPPLMRMERSYVQGFFWRWGHVDLLPSLEWHGAVYLPSGEVLGSVFRNSKGFLEASLPHQAVVCWFTSLIWGGFFKERYREIIVRAARECEDRLCRSLEYAVGPFWARRLVEVARAGRPETSVAWVRSLRRVLWWRAFQPRASPGRGPGLRGFGRGDGLGPSGCRLLGGKRSSGPLARCQSYLGPHALP